MILFIPFDIPFDNSEYRQKIIIDDLIFEESDDLVLYKNIWTYKDTVALDYFVKEKYDYYVKEATYIINEYNSESYTHKSVEVLLGDVILSYMSSLFFKKNILEKLKRKYDDFDVLVTNNNFMAKEVTDVFYNFSSVDFHSMQYEELSDYLNINTISVQKSEEKELIKKEQSIKDKVYEKVAELLFKLPFNKSLVFGHNINKNILFNMVKIPFKTLFQSFYLPRNELINVRFSDEIDSITRKGLFNSYKEKDIILAIILKNLPTAALEGLQKRKKHIINIFGKERRFSIYTGVGIYTSSFLKYLCFFYQNIKLNFFQHGGLYGMSKNHHQGYFYENRVSDKFFKWGEYDGEKNILSAYQINRKYKYDKDIKKDIDFLFVLSTGHKQYASTGYYSSPLRKTNLECMLDLYEFLYAKYKKTIMRTLNYCNEHKYIFENYKNIELDKNKKFYDSLKSIDIIITDHFGTTYLEALALDLPVIVILNRENQAVIYTKAFEEFISDMKRNNVLFDSIDEFKDYFKNKEQIMNNWFTKEVSCLKEKICRNYLMKDSNYVNTLIEVLKKDNQ